MAAIDWLKVRGFEFTPDEARQASDFEEVLRNWALSPDKAYEMFKADFLSVGQRLFFAERVSLEQATLLLIMDGDGRVCNVIRKRLDEQRKEEEQVSGIILPA